MPAMVTAVMKLTPDGGLTGAKDLPLSSKDLAQLFRVDYANTTGPFFLGFVFETLGMGVVLVLSISYLLDITRRRQLPGETSHRLSVTCVLASLVLAIAKTLVDIVRGFKMFGVNFSNPLAFLLPDPLFFVSPFLGILATMISQALLLRRTVRFISSLAHLWQWLSQKWVRWSFVTAMTLAILVAAIEGSIASATIMQAGFLPRLALGGGSDEFAKRMSAWLWTAMAVDIVLSSALCTELWWARKKLSIRGGSMHEIVTRMILITLHGGLAVTALQASALILYNFNVDTAWCYMPMAFLPKIYTVTLILSLSLPQSSLERSPSVAYSLPTIRTSTIRPESRNGHQPTLGRSTGANPYDSRGPQERLNATSTWSLSLPQPRTLPRGNYGTDLGVSDRPNISPGQRSFSTGEVEEKRKKKDRQRVGSGPGRRDRLRPGATASAPDPGARWSDVMRHSWRRSQALFKWTLAPTIIIGDDDAEGRTGSGMGKQIKQGKMMDEEKDAERESAPVPVAAPVPILGLEKRWSRRGLIERPSSADRLPFPRPASDPQVRRPSLIPLLSSPTNGTPPHVSSRRPRPTSNVPAPRTTSRGNSPLPPTAYPSSAVEAASGWTTGFGQSFSRRGSAQSGSTAVPSPLHGGSPLVRSATVPEPATPVVPAFDQTDHSAQHSPTRRGSLPPAGTPRSGKYDRSASIPSLVGTDRLDNGDPMMINDDAWRFMSIPMTFASDYTEPTDHSRAPAHDQSDPEPRTPIDRLGSGFMYTDKDLPTPPPVGVTVERQHSFSSFISASPPASLPGSSSGPGTKMSVGAIHGSPSRSVPWAWPAGGTSGSRGSASSSGTLLDHFASPRQAPYSPSSLRASTERGQKVPGATGATPFWSTNWIRRATEPELPEGRVGRDEAGDAYVAPMDQRFDSRGDHNQTYGRGLGRGVEERVQGVAFDNLDPFANLPRSNGSSINWSGRDQGQSTGADATFGISTTNNPTAQQAEHRTLGIPSAGSGPSPGGGVSRGEDEDEDEDDAEDEERRRAGRGRMMSFQDMLGA